MDPYEKTDHRQLERRIGSYGAGGLYGSVGGAAAGLLVGGGKRSIIAGGALGAAAGLAGRAKLGKRVDKLERENKPIKATLVGGIPAQAGLLTAAGVIVGGGHILRGAYRAGNMSRNGIRVAKGKVTDFFNKGKTEVVGRVSPSIKPVRKMLMSERSELSSILRFKAVDLGYTYPEYGCGSATSIVAKRVNYPSLYIDDRENEIDLPLTGTAKVKFKLRSKTTRQDEDGKKRHSASIEIQSIDPDEPEPVKPGAATPLKVLRSELSDIIQFARKKIQLRKKGPQSPIMDAVPGDCPGATTILSERNQLNAILQLAADPRSRNRLGEFDGSDGGPNQMAIHATYRQGLAEGAIGGAAAIKGGQALSRVLKKARRA